MKNLATFVIFALIVAGGVYWYFFSDSEQVVLTVDTTPGATERAHFESLAATLQSISFKDTSLFTDPRFVSLINLETPIVPEPRGRIDPFAVLDVTESALSAPELNQ